MACDSVRFESCLVKKYCWYQNDAQSCTSTNQLAVSKFMKCFEGPYANREATPDPSRRKICMEEAKLDYEMINNCASNKTEVDEIEYQLNLTRAPMYKMLGPTPGLFPHIFVNHQHLWNNSWAALVRKLCNEFITKSIVNELVVPKICHSNSVNISFSFVNINPLEVNKTLIMNHLQKFENAIVEATNFLTSKTWLPINFGTSQPDGSPSYVNIKAASSATVIAITDDGNNIDIQFEIEILNAFYNSNILNGIVDDSFPSFLAWAMQKNGFVDIEAKNIKNQKL
jgi:hypothetical protein